MSLLIIKEYLEILLINKMLKHQWLFWELNLIVTIILENDTIKVKKVSTQKRLKNLQ